MGTIFARQGLHAGAELPGAEPDRQSRAANWSSGVTIACSGISTGNNVGWAPRWIDRELQAQQDHHPASGLVCGRLRETVPTPSKGNCIPNVRQGGSKTPFVDATDDGNVVYVRAPMKVAGMVLEPTYIWHDGGTGGMNKPRPANQSRHTLGGRAVKKFATGSVRVDVTVEGYYQFGDIGPGANTAGGARSMDIEAYAFHIDGGVTLPVPMQPRLSAEFNTASGNKGDGKWGSFDQLYPTNHIHFGYMDRMAWKNMNHVAIGLQLRPNKDSHFEVTGHLFSLAEEADGWYGANQAAIIGADARQHRE